MAKKHCGNQVLLLFFFFRNFLRKCYQVSSPLVDMYPRDKRRKVRNSKFLAHRCSSFSLCVRENLWNYWMGDGGEEDGKDSTGRNDVFYSLRIRKVPRGLSLPPVRAMVPLASVCSDWFAAAWLVSWDIGKVSMRVRVHGHGRRSVRSGILDNSGINLALLRRRGTPGGSERYTILSILSSTREKFWH